jgi:aspartyl-tRNA(Asn)/glutamyl-tRNA(Gln) amidotransferase subunit A
VGVPSAFHVAECPDEVRSAWIGAADRLQELGARVDVIGPDVVSPEILQQSLASYYLLACAEASSNLARYDGVRYGCKASEALSETVDDSTLQDRLKEWSFLERQYSRTRSQGFGPEVVRRVICGTYVLSSDKFHTHYEAAATIRAILAQQLRRALEACSCLLVPTALSPPPLLQHAVDPTSMIANDVMTVAASLAGLPSVAMPCGPKAPPAGARPSLQLIGPRLGEGEILRAALALERSFADCE